MSVFTRLANRVWPRRLAADLEEEVTFHLDMRASENSNAGMSDDEATQRAREQFGDVGAVVADMRKERLTSTTMLVAMTTLVMTVVILWIALQQLGNKDLTVPAVRAVSTFKDPNRRMGSPGSPPPPRPGPGPTWTQFVRQTKAFEALAKGPGTYSPGRLIDDEGRLINERAKTR